MNSPLPFKSSLRAASSVVPTGALEAEGAAELAALAADTEPAGAELADTMSDDDDAESP